MVRRRVVLTGNSGWTTRLATNASRFVAGNSTAGPSSLQKPKKKKKTVRVTKVPSPAKLEKQRARIQTLLTKMRAAREDGDYESIPPLWGQAKSHLNNVYGAKATQLGVYKEMQSHHAWARNLLNARKKARKKGVSSGTADPRRGPAPPNPLRLDHTDVREGHCIHDLAIDQCTYCFPSAVRKVSSTRSARRTSR